MGLYSCLGDHADLTERFIQLSGYTALSGGQTVFYPDEHSSQACLLLQLSMAVFCLCIISVNCWRGQ